MPPDPKTLDAALTRACAELDRLTGECPLSHYDGAYAPEGRFSHDDCGEHCDEHAPFPEGGGGPDTTACWRDWFLRDADDAAP